MNQSVENACSATQAASVSGTIRVAVCGAMGKMGKEVVKAVMADPQLQLVGAVDRASIGKDAGLEAGSSEASGVPVAENLTQVLQSSNAQVCVDFTHPSCIFDNAMAIIAAGCRPVIGTTGLEADAIEKIRKALTEKGLGGLVVPNFAIGAVLMMKFAQEAARYFEHAEIIELHHNRKADAPSGTSLKTAELMLEGLKGSGKEAFIGSEVPEKETVSGARGATVNGNIHIHSVRLPGFIAHQEVLLTGPGQILTLRHDSMDRQSFMPGVVLAATKVMELNGLVYGLEHIL